jgi:hypothetical protein
LGLDEEEGGLSFVAHILGGEFGSVLANLLLTTTTFERSFAAFMGSKSREYVLASISLT